MSLLILSPFHWVWSQFCVDSVTSVIYSDSTYPTPCFALQCCTKYTHQLYMICNNYQHIVGRQVWRSQFMWRYVPTPLLLMNNAVLLVVCTKHQQLKYYFHSLPRVAILSHATHIHAHTTLHTQIFKKLLRWQLEYVGQY